MDPYLEDPALWPDVHHRLISEIQEVLNAQLRPRYFARVELRVYISDEADPGRSVLIPDVRLSEHDHSSTATLPEFPGSGIQPIEVMTALEEEIEEAYLEIRETVSGNLVTVIEVLSPTNKAGGASGRESFLSKRRAVMRAKANWVEIDLLRAGLPTLSREFLPASHYVVHISKITERPKGKVWPLPLQHPLPPIPIPLKSPDSDTPLKLQSIVERAYEKGAYDMSIDYGQPPPPPLSADDARWVRGVLKDVV